MNKAHPRKKLRPTVRKSKSRIRILAVDDEEIMGYLITRIADNLGYRLDWVRDCETAFGKMKEREYDVIISDFKLPGMTGEMFYEKILAVNEPLARRMIFITGDVMNRHTQTFFSRVKLPYLSKPFEIDALSDTIENLIRAC